ncbi:DUF6257 family protein [Streptomyces sp. TRM68416]|uniref:DUF6257 family protein n=1 Tax=Streptomyces sp. TRM68416 TaxID=2758412 RepID=UPI001661D50A|nr:DUF6257 family protein [Streptomyces sp. TRM68416]MBD0838802.1 hypothetical protein [Streptomyces sp. TRM68416]
MADDDITFSDFTTGEKLRVIGLVARMAKRGMADDGSGRVLKDLQDRVARIEKQAQRRKNSK